jgi:hypothetical protein
LEEREKDVRTSDMEERVVDMLIGMQASAEDELGKS